MSVIIILLVVSIFVAALFLFGFIWSVRNRQYEDEFSPPVRILFDDNASISKHSDVPTRINEQP